MDSNLNNKFWREFQNPDWIDNSDVYCRIQCGMSLVTSFQAWSSSNMENQYKSHTQWKQENQYKSHTQWKQSSINPGNCFERVSPRWRYFRRQSVPRLGNYLFDDKKPCILFIHIAAQYVERTQRAQFINLFLSFLLSVPGERICNTYFIKSHLFLNFKPSE
jgi:hypothetical protein